jgi:hypothetical protein
MHGRRSLNLELTPLDPDLERNLTRAHRAHIEMEDISRNEEQEELMSALKCLFEPLNLYSLGS